MSRQKRPRQPEDDQPLVACGRNVPDLHAAVDALLLQVPRGRVTTYGNLANALGDVGAARWVGEYLLDHRHRARCRCHRVVRSTGELGNYIEGDGTTKRDKLDSEAVEVHNDHVDLDRFGFNRFSSTRPLAQLRAIQEHLASRIVLTGITNVPDLVAGVDVSYRSPSVAFGTYALVSGRTNELLWSTTVRREIEFPYISGFLAFRELPLLLQLLDEADAKGQRADLILVDGQGILHHRHAGIACHFGVTGDVPTIGVAKTLLCGQVNLKAMRPDDPRPVVHDGDLVAMALGTNPRFRPIFISPGHKISVTNALRVVRRLIVGHKLPEPLYWADFLSRQAAREFAGGGAPVGTSNGSQGR